MCCIHSDARDTRVTIPQKTCGLAQEWPEVGEQQKPETRGMHGGGDSWIFTYKAREHRGVGLAECQGPGHGRFMLPVDEGALYHGRDRSH